MDTDSDHLVSDLVKQVTVPIELSFPGSELKAYLRGLLDSGCTRCLVNPALVEKTGNLTEIVKSPSGILLI